MIGQIGVINLSNSKLSNAEVEKLISDNLKALDTAHKTMSKQSETIDAAIKMRLFNSHIIEMLKAINANGKLTPTIDNMTKLCKDFDLLARDYSRHNRIEYMEKTAEVENAARATYKVPVPYNVKKVK